MKGGRARLSSLQSFDSSGFSVEVGNGPGNQISYQHLGPFPLRMRNYLFARMRSRFVVFLSID